MVYTELYNEEEIRKVMNEHWHADDNSLLPPLFHGTDYSLIDLSASDRAVINKACESIIKTIHKLFRERGISNWGDKTLNAIKDSHGSAQLAYINAGGRINKNPLYEYGDFYVTNNPERAESFSREAWIYGETGWVAKMLLEGARSLNIKLPSDEEFVNAYNTIDNRRKMIIKDPTIIIVTDCKYSELYSEQGEQVVDDSEMDILNRPNKIEARNYRLGKSTLEKDAIYYVVRKELITDLIRIYYEYTD